MILEFISGIGIPIALLMSWLLVSIVAAIVCGEEKCKEKNLF